MLHNLSDSFGVARRAEESFVGVGGSALLLRIFLRFAAGGDVEETFLLHFLAAAGRVLE